MTTPGPLANVRVLDLSSLVAGPFATKLMADLGADVIKIEPPSGDPARRLGPFQDDDSRIEKSGLFFYLNTNKRSVTLDLANADARRVVLRLARDADVVVESFLPGVMAGMGLGYGDLKAVRPDIVLVSVTNFGQTGPYRHFKASDLVLYAMGAEMYSVGIEGRPPIKQAGLSATFYAGAMAAVATMGGLMSARLQGRGQWVDVSLFEAQLSTIDRRVPALVGYQFSGRIARRSAGSSEGFPGGVYPCADGYIEIYSSTAMWDRVVRMLGSPPALLDPKWSAPGANIDPALSEEFHAIFYEWLFPKTRQEAWQAAQAARLPSAPLYTTADVLADPVLQQRGAWADVEHEVMGKVRIPGRPAVWSRTPWAIRRPPPLLGQHTREVLLEVGCSAAEITTLRQTGAI